MKTILALTTLTLCAISAHAQSYTSQRIGGFTYNHGSDGSSWTSQSIGHFQYYHGNDGGGHTWSGTGQTIGNFRYYNFSH